MIKPIEQSDIEFLAELSRLELGLEEKKGYARDLSAILAYIDEVKKFGGEAGPEHASIDIQTINSMREDEVTHQTGEYSPQLVEAAPEYEEGRVKVKKIL